MSDTRHLVTDNLADTLVVEAAAGTGKTTALVRRIVRLLASGAAGSITEVVAVTFTEKAAGELKLRLREEIERARAAADVSPDEAARLEDAVRRFEEAHISTIHGFCAELLRERPVESRVDPAFAVLTESQADRLYGEAFDDWLQRQLADPDEGVRRSLRRPQLTNFGMDEEEGGPVARLRRAGHELLGWRDHRGPWSRPDFDRDAVVDALLEGVRRFADLTASPINARDTLYTDTAPARTFADEVKRAQDQGIADHDGWEAMLTVLAGNRTLGGSRKGSGAQYSRTVARQPLLDARMALVGALEDFRQKADADLAALLHQEFEGCLQAYEDGKTRIGALDFLDLLIRARDLVRDDREVRREFQRRFRFVLVDEFQDTDPLQAELLLLLTADEPDGFAGDPATLPTRRGALFIVGDPKQSIYRFRRADVGVYRRVCARLLNAGAKPVELSTSFRSVPDIQHLVNAAFRPLMGGDDVSLQADYVPLGQHREAIAGQPSVVALPIPAPYGKFKVTGTAIAASLPSAVAEFVRWLVNDSGWRVVPVEGPHEARPVQPGDICLLFRRFISFRDDVTRPYVEALEARGIPHLLVGGKAFHEREEVDVVRTALAAIEWPEDELSVFATLRGPLFAVGEEALLEYHHLARRFHPFSVPDGLPAHLMPVAEALGLLRTLHAARNHRPVADTIGRVLEATRAHAAFVLWRGGEQALANVLHLGDLARKYEAEGGLSFRGFVEMLQEAAGRAEAPEAPILEEGSEGVRLMTVHKAKGLEFPVVILVDIDCKLSRPDASRHIDTSRDLAAIKLGGWAPVDLLEHNAEEAARDAAEGVRLAYVAATRARDLLVVPAVGDGPHEGGWIAPLNGGIYPPVDQRQDPAPAPGCPVFAGRDTVLERPNHEGPGRTTVRPGGYALTDPASGDPYQVVWWDPTLLLGKGDDGWGLRRDDLISREVADEDVAADRERYDTWAAWRRDAIAAGARPSTEILTATEWSRAASGSADGVEEAAVEVVHAGTDEVRPSGRRFGVLVHALLAAVPLDALPADISDHATLHARLLGATDEERAAAATVVDRALRHPVLDAARAAAAAGRTVRRESPVSIVLPGSDAPRHPGTPVSSTLIDGQVDLAFEDAEGAWVVVDFKTDAELGEAEAGYRRQVALYAAAIARATGRPARGILMRL
ncbi:MAG: UvrD-helicase domain-containing protein [Vicinamibacterales bacterium]|nr:UvrD-helicase domain-containing protein [Vicinamibacterales bacterium]